MYDFNKDQDSVASGWEQCIKPNDTIEEGILDRIKARTSSAVSNVGNTIAGLTSGDKEIKDRSNALKKQNSPVKKLEQTLEDRMNGVLSNFLNDAVKVSKANNAEGLSDALAYQRISQDEKMREEIIMAMLYKMDDFVSDIKSRNQPQPSTAQPQA